MYLLSICIPTFNRKNDLKNMLDSIKSNNDIEVVICDDGSTDNTNELVKNYYGKLNINYIFQKNAGVSAAMLTAYNNSSGKYVIKMDSDDLFTDDGLNFILEVLNKNPNQVAFLFGVKTIKKNFYSENIPPSGNINFISVYADHSVKGDLKQIVRTEIVLKYMYKVPINVRRIPPGLLWFKIAEDYNCLSFNEAVAIKNYLDDGITSKILYLNASYPEALVELNQLLVNSKVYKSIIYRWRSRLLWSRYSFHNNSIQLKNWWHWIVLIPGLCIFIIDRIKLNQFKEL
jgi:glycosyltransferase involved in cell wall biosynthesis